MFKDQSFNVTLNLTLVLVLCLSLLVYYITEKESVEYESFFGKRKKKGGKKKGGFSLNLKKIKKSVSSQIKKSVSSVEKSVSSQINKTVSSVGKEISRGGFYNPIKSAETENNDHQNHIKRKISKGLKSADPNSSGHIDQCKNQCAVQYNSKVAIGHHSGDIFGGNDILICESNNLKYKKAKSYGRQAQSIYIHRKNLDTNLYGPIKYNDEVRLSTNSQGCLTNVYRISSEEGHTDDDDVLYGQRLKLIETQVSKPKTFDIKIYPYVYDHDNYGEYCNPYCGNAIGAF